MTPGVSAGSYWSSPIDSSSVYAGHQLVLVGVVDVRLQPGGDRRERSGRRTTRERHRRSDRQRPLDRLVGGVGIDAVVGRHRPALATTLVVTLGGLGHVGVARRRGVRRCAGRAWCLGARRRSGVGRCVGAHHRIGRDGRIGGGGIVIVVVATGRGDQGCRGEDGNDPGRSSSHGGSPWGSGGVARIVHVALRRTVVGSDHGQDAGASSTSSAASLARTGIAACVPAGLGTITTK